MLHNKIKLREFCCCVPRCQEDKGKYYLFFPFKDLLENLLTRNKQDFFIRPKYITSPLAVAAAADWQHPNPYKSRCETFRLSKNTIVSKYWRKMGYVTIIHTTLYVNLTTPSQAFFYHRHNTDYLPTSVLITRISMGLSNKYFRM